MTAPKLILHVGHGKTGTSALQTAFALNKAKMLEQGICYPEHHSLAKARLGKTTSGNVRSEDISSVFDAARGEAPDARVYLMSNEQMFDSLPRHLDQVAVLKAQGVELEALLMIRDPLDDVMSTYGQSVKKRGYTHEFGRFLNGYNRPAKVLDFLAQMETAGVTTSVLNYSRRKTALTDSVLTWLNIDAASAIPNPLGTVNRSLTASETGLQRAFNKYLGTRASLLIANVMAHRFPDKVGQKPKATRERLVAFKDRIAPEVEKVNAKLPNDEQYSLADLDAAIEVATETLETKVTFSQDEITVLAKSLSSHMFPDGTADTLVSVVERGSKSGKMPAEDQLALLQLAQHAKPKSAKINAMIAHLQPSGE